MGVSPPYPLLMGFTHHEPCKALLWESAEKFGPGLANPGWDDAHRARIAGYYSQLAPDRHSSHFTKKFNERAGAEAAPCIDLFLDHHFYSFWHSNHPFPKGSSIPRSLHSRFKRGAPVRAGFSASSSLLSALRFPCAGTRFLLLAYALDSESKMQAPAETAQQGRSRALVHLSLAVPVHRASVALCFAATPADLKECIPLSWGIVARSPLH